MFAARTFTASALRRTFATSARAEAAKVAVLGAAGGIGQPLSLLLKQSPLVTELSLYDIVNTPGVAADLSHINTNSTVKGYTPEDGGLHKALEGCDVVVIPAGVPRKPGMTRDDLFNTNASIVRDLVKGCAAACPKAKILIISNPVNSTVPIASEVLKQAGVYDAKRVFGVTTLDVVRASRFASEISGKDPKDVHVPVVGGHAGITIVPLFSQVSGFATKDNEQRDALVKRTQFGGDEVVQAKAGTGSATLSMAYAGAVFTEQVLRAGNGEKGIIAPAFVRSSLFEKEGLQYFSSPIELGVNGVEKIHGLGELSPYEQELVKAAIPELAKSEQKGIKFVQ